MSRTREVELKLEVPADDVSLLTRSPLLHAARRKSSHSSRLVSIYFDTDNLNLHNAGLSLQVRRIGRRYVQAIRQENFENPRRHEWEHDLAGRQHDLDTASNGALKPIFNKELSRRLKPIFEVR